MRILPLLVVFVVGCGSAPKSAETTPPREVASAPASPPAPPPAPESPFPPSVLSGEGVLNCDISSTQNGSQRLALTGGSGLEFEVAVSPIVDGTVNTKGPEKGGVYRFTSHLVKPAPGKLAGVGEVTIELLETKVSVEMMKYQQPGGPGTALSFNAADIARGGVYVEFFGRAKSPQGDKYAFRVNLGGATGGSGKVIPQDSNDNSRIMSKMVVIRAPTTTVVTTTIQKLP